MTICLTLEQAIDIHAKTIEVSGGGAVGVLDVQQLESVLAHIKNDDYYPTFVEKLTHLFFGACKFHCFQDGNKRIAIALTGHMLSLNGYMYCLGSYYNKMENISYHVASGAINKDLLREIITAVLEKQDEQEDLKLKILNAIQGDVE